MANNNAVGCEECTARENKVIIHKKFYNFFQKEQNFSTFSSIINKINVKINFCKLANYF